MFPHFNDLKKDMPDEIRKNMGFLEIPIDEYKGKISYCIAGLIT
jgi:hypothetical protein